METSSFCVFYILLCGVRFRSEFRVKLFADIADLFDLSGGGCSCCNCARLAFGRQFHLDFTLDIYLFRAFTRLAFFGCSVFNNVRHYFRGFRIADVAGLASVVGGIDQQRSDGVSLYKKIRMKNCTKVTT